MSRVLANASADDRSGTDFYPTPPEATQALLDWAGFDRGGVIWEPAAGQGHMVRVLEANGYKVAASDLYTMEGDDFTKADKLRGGVIVTNPPFKHAEAFIRKAHELRADAFAFLVKSQFWHAKRRHGLFREIRPKAVLPLTWRPDFLMGRKSSAPTMEVVWTVWERGYEGPTLYHPLDKPNAKETI